MAIDPLYDKVYEHTHNFNYNGQTITLTSHFESHFNRYRIGLLEGTVNVQTKVSSGGFYCEMWFPPTYIPGVYWLDFYPTSDYANPKSMEYFRPNIETGIVDGQVKVEVYKDTSLLNKLAEYYINLSDIFVHIDTSVPTLDRLSVTTNYLGTIPSVDIKVSHPYLIFAEFDIETPDGTFKWLRPYADDNGVAEKTFTDWVNSQSWESGHQYSYTVAAMTWLSNFILERGTITFDSKVTGIVLNNLQQMNTGQTQQAGYTLLKPDGAAGPFKYPGATFSSSNTSVATINSSGLITAVAYGTATITVVSNDPWCDPSFSDSKTLIVTPTPGAFPTLETDYTRITKGDIEDFLSAEEILKATLNPSNWTTITFDGYSHSVFTIYELIGDIIDNLQQLTAKYLIDNPSSATAQQLNSQAQGCTIDRENSLYPTGVTAWRVTFRTISQTLIGLADAIL